MSERRRKGVTIVDWGAAARALPGEQESGDRMVVQATADGVLVAALDGLGHGHEAATAAGAAAAVLEANPRESVIALLRRCHEATRGTRGVVVSLASFDPRDGTMTWAGVGNVAGVLLRAGWDAHPVVEYLLARPGAVGFRLPTLHATVLPLAPGDTLIFATDGISADFVPTSLPTGPPQSVADAILARHGKPSDDALVVVARYRGGDA